MGELNNLFMGSRQICVIKVVELKAFTAKPAEKALHPRSCFAIFNDIVRTVAVVASYFDRSHKSKSMDSIKIVLSTHLNLHQMILKRAYAFGYTPDVFQGGGYFADWIH